MITGTRTHPEYPDDGLFGWKPPKPPPAPPTNPPNGDGDGSDGAHNRADQIFARFKKFHKANPYIWKLFVEYSWKLINAGRELYGVAAVIERIRWHIDIETRTPEPFKISNDFRAYYARMFNICHKPIFKLRELRSQKRPPQHGGEPWTGADPPPDPAREARIMDELEKMGRE
jgi:hypothetical protein